MNKKHALLAVGFAVASLFSCSKDPLPEPQVSEEATMAATATKQTLNRANDFYFGVNGQPFGTVYPYKTLSAQEQVKIINSLGMNIYRFCAAFQIANGKFTEPYLFRPLKAAADEGKITLLPYFSIRTMSYDKTLAQNYNEARTFGARIGRENRDNLHYYEVGNELDNQCIIRATGNSGEKIAHYDGKKLSTITAAIKGMIDGIKSTDPTAKIIVNCSWMHYAFMDYLLKRGARIDIIGWHWYGDMEEAAKKNYKIDDITQFLSNKYNKPIWFTEFNLKANSNGSPMDENKQHAFITSFLSKCQKNPKVGAALIWELFDQPNRSAAERNYGIITYEGNTGNNMEPKIFAKTTSLLFK